MSKYTIKFDVINNESKCNGLFLSKKEISFSSNKKYATSTILSNIEIYIIKFDIKYSIKELKITSTKRKEKNDYQIISEIKKISVADNEIHEYLTGVIVDEDNTTDLNSSTLKDIILNAKRIFSYKNINKKKVKLKEIRDDINEINNNEEDSLQRINKSKLFKNTLIDYNQENQIAPLIEKNHSIKELQNIGIKNISNLIIFGHIKTMYQENEFERRLRDHSKFISIASLLISNEIKGINKTEVYLTSILQNIGAIFLAREFKNKEYESIIIEQINKPYEFYNKELSLFETTHVYAGASLMKKWSINNDIIRSTLMHHLENPFESNMCSENSKKISAIIFLANYCVMNSDKYFDDESENMERIIDKALRFLGIQPDFIDLVIDELDKEHQKKLFAHFTN